MTHDPGGGAEARRFLHALIPDPTPLLGMFLVIWLKLLSGGSHTERLSVGELDRVTAYVSKVADEADVYLGVGLQDEDLGASRRGGSEHVRALVGFWADVDVAGPAHPQQNLPADRDEALRILADFPLPPEAVIDSGHGFHVHWPFDRPWILPDEDERRRARRRGSALPADPLGALREARSGVRRDRRPRPRAPDPRHAEPQGGRRRATGSAAGG